MPIGGRKAVMAFNGAPHIPGIIYTANEKEAIAKRVAELAEADLRRAYGEKVKQVRQDGIAEVKQRVTAQLSFKLTAS